MLSADGLSLQSFNMSYTSSSSIWTKLFSSKGSFFGSKFSTLFLSEFSTLFLSEFSTLYGFESSKIFSSESSSFTQSKSISSEPDSETDWILKSADAERKFAPSSWSSVRASVMLASILQSGFCSDCDVEARENKLIFEIYSSGLRFTKLFYHSFNVNSLG